MSVKCLTGCWFSNGKPKLKYVKTNPQTLILYITNLFLLDHSHYLKQLLSYETRPFQIGLYTEYGQASEWMTV